MATLSKLYKCSLMLCKQHAVECTHVAMETILHFAFAFDTSNGNQCMDKY